MKQLLQRFLFCFLAFVASTPKINAQLNITFPFFSDAYSSVYHVQFNTSLCDPKQGDYTKAVQYLKSNTTVDKFQRQFVEYLIQYQTEGKLKTWEVIESSTLSNTEKDLLKLRILAATKNDNDYNSLYNKLSEKYPTNISLMKIDVRRKLQERHDLIYTTTDFQALSQKLEHFIIKTKLSPEDQLYFQLLQLDADYYAAENTGNMVVLRNQLLYKFVTLWKANPSAFNKEYTLVNVKVKSDNSNHFEKLTNTEDLGESIFEPYHFIYYGPNIDDYGTTVEKYIPYIQKNPFYYRFEEGGYNLSEGKWNPSPKKVKSEDELKKVLSTIEQVIVKYPGALGPKMTYLDVLIKNKEFVYGSKNEQQYLKNYTKRLIDLFALDQRATFQNQFTIFRDILKEDRDNIKVKEYPKIFFNQLKPEDKDEIKEYLSKRKTEFPLNENLILFANEFSGN